MSINDSILTATSIRAYYEGKAALKNSTLTNTAWKGTLNGNCNLDIAPFAEVTVNDSIKFVGNKIGGGIKEVIFHDPATIVYWNNGDKTIVKACEHDTFDPEKGLMMAIVKYTCGNDNRFHALLKQWVPEQEHPVLKNLNPVSEAIFMDAPKKMKKKKKK